ncbi:MAG: (2Fe-2S)-binding protein [Anaerolineaceae bacterium]|nr:MAG: xanthine dehydrogenase [Chloroflexi bacterium HGW-Chloroflexi-8]
MVEKISFSINGQPREVEVDPEMMLIDVIREVLSLTGTKHGCDNATCGTCTVILNGKAVKSCNTPVKKASNGTLLTIEGLAKGKELHPIQKSIAESGAIQCGFCTPGIVMELYGLLESKPEASETEINNALNKHLCRCTGYEPIQDGALMAQKIIINRKNY